MLTRWTNKRLMYLGQLVLVYSVQFICCEQVLSPLVHSSVMTIILRQHFYTVNSVLPAVFVQCYAL